MPASFAQIKEVQARTGKSLKECKDALNRHDCDIDKAVEDLGGDAAAAAPAATAAAAAADSAPAPNAAEAAPPPAAAPAEADAAPAPAPSPAAAPAEEAATSVNNGDDEEKAKTLGANAISAGDMRDVLKRRSEKRLQERLSSKTTAM